MRISKTIFRFSAFSAVFFVTNLGMTSPAVAGPDEYIGEIIMGGWNFCPRHTIKADGQILPINRYTALFSLYGTNYGGDGRTTFGIPDLRGRSPVHNGQGPGLPDHRLGHKGSGSAASSSPNTGILVIQYCVVTQGIFPSRS